MDWESTRQSVYSADCIRGLVSGARISHRFSIQWNALKWKSFSFFPHTIAGIIVHGMHVVAMLLPVSGITLDFLTWQLIFCLTWKQMHWALLGIFQMFVFADSAASSSFLMVKLWKTFLMEFALYSTLTTWRRTHPQAPVIAQAKHLFAVFASRLAFLIIASRTAYVLPRCDQIGRRATQAAASSTPYVDFLPSMERVVVSHRHDRAAISFLLSSRHVTAKCSRMRFKTRLAAVWTFANPFTCNWQVACALSCNWQVTCALSVSGRTLLRAFKSCLIISSGCVSRRVPRKTSSVLLLGCFAWSLLKCSWKQSMPSVNMRQRQSCVFSIQHHTLLPLFCALFNFHVSSTPTKVLDYALYWNDIPNKPKRHRHLHLNEVWGIWIFVSTLSKAHNRHGGTLDWSSRQSSPHNRTLNGIRLLSSQRLICSSPGCRHVGFCRLTKSFVCRRMMRNDLKPAIYASASHVCVATKDCCFQCQPL